VNKKFFVRSLVHVSIAIVSIAQAQQTAKIPRIAFLVPSTPAGYALRIEAFQRGLKDLGYVEGKNIISEYRYTEGKVDQDAGPLAELIAANVNLIVTSRTETVLRAKKATRAIPIVFVGIGDPIANQLVASLARPGENLTGLSNLSPELGGKRLELLKEIVPRLSRVAVLLWKPQGRGAEVQIKELEHAAPALGLTLQHLEVQGQSADALETAFRNVTNRSQALVGLQSPVFGIYRARIAELAIARRLPAMHADAAFPEAGGLVSYGASSTDMFRRAATYVDKILKGAKPADLPVEQPMKFEFVVNLKTAKQIGVTIPPNVLVRADRVIK
jgi:putative ABC transport system substrate-binding protein